LSPRLSVEQATANVNILFRQILLSFPDAKLNQENLSRLNKSHVTLKSMERGLSYLCRAYSEPLQVLIVIVALVLLIACANIANLLLARSTARERELAVRQALGVARTRIMRQLLTESLLLAFAGGALGIGFAAAANRVLLAMLPHGQNTIPLDVSLNLRLLGLTFVVTVCTAVLFGTLPSLRATRLQLTESLKSGSGAAPGAARSPLGRILVASQVALSLVLMVGACLFLRTLINLSRAGMGFNKENVLRMDIDYTLTGYKDDNPRLKLLYNQIEARVNPLPDVIAGSFGFLPDLIKPVAKGRPSFEGIEAIRVQLCPEASQQASIIGISRAWPTACILLQARMGLKRGERRDIAQGDLGFHDRPIEVLRATQVSPNDAARASNLVTFPNMRVLTDRSSIKCSPAVPWMDRQ
jgi:cell division protein FtsX